MTQEVAPRTQFVIGDSIGEFTRETGFDNWNRYAAVNSEFVPIHMDDEAGRRAGMGGAFGMGNLQLSYLHILARSWAGDSGRLVELTVQFRKPNRKGLVTVGGAVTAVDVDVDGTKVTADVWTRDADGGDLARGTAVIVFD